MATPPPIPFIDPSSLRSATKAPGAAPAPIVPSAAKRRTPLSVEDVYAGPSWEEAGLEVPDLVKDALPGGLPTRPYKEEVIDEEGNKVMREAYGIDLRKTAQGVAETRLKMRTAQWSASNPGSVPAPEQLAAWRDAETRAAHKMLTSAVAKSAGAPMAFIDDDPTERTKELVEAAENPLLRPLVPIAAWLSPYTHDVYKPKEKDPGVTATASQYGGWQWLSWLAQGAPSTYVATSLRHGLGTEAQVEAIREGEDLMSPYYLEKMSAANPLYHELNAFGAVTPENEKLVKTLTGLPIGLGIAILEPDAITGALVGAGKLVKVGKSVRAGVKAVDTAVGLQEANRALLATEAGVDAAHAAELAGRASGAPVEVVRAAAQSAARGAAQQVPEAAPVDKLATFTGAARSGKSAELLDAEAKAELTTRAAARVDAMLDAGKADDPDGTNAVQIVEGVQAALRKSSPSLAKGVEWMMQAQTGMNLPASGVTVRLMGGLRYSRDRFNKAISSIASGTEASADVLRVLAMPIKELREYALSKGVVGGGYMGREYILQSLGLPAAVKKGKYAHAHVKDPVAAANVAELELRVRQTAALASEAVVQDLNAYLAVLKAFSGKRKGVSPENAATLSKEADDAFSALAAARRTMVTADDPAAVEKAEEAARSAAARFAKVMQVAGESLGANASKVLDTQILIATQRRSEAIADLDELAGALESSAQPHLVALVNKHGRAFNSAMEKVKGAASQEARGNMVLRVYASTLRAVGQSYSKLSGVLSGSIASAAPAPVESVLRAVEKAVDEVQTFPGNALDELLRVVPRDTLVEAAKRSDLGDAQQLAAAVLDNRATTLSIDAAKAAETLARFAKANSSDADGTAVAEALQLHERMIQYGSPLVMNKAFANIRQWFKPQLAKYVGEASDAVVNIGGGLVTGQKIMQREVLSVVANTVGRDGRIAALERYVSDPAAAFTFDSIVGVSSGKAIIHAVSGRPMWEEARAIFLALDKGPEALRAIEPCLEGLSRMWLPPGAEARTKTGALLEGAKNILRFARPTVPADETERLIAQVAASNLTFSDFSRLMREFTADVVGGGAPSYSASAILESEGVRATAFGAQLVGQLALLQRARVEMGRETSGIAEDVVRAAADLASGNTAKVGENWEKAMVVFSALKIPPKLGQQTVHHGRDLFHGLIAIDADATGAAAIMPRRWLDTMAENMGNIVKSAEEYSAKAVNPEEKWHADTVGAVAQLWKTGLTTGVLFAKPRYFANMVVGNFSQVWQEAGFWQALSNTGSVLTDWSAGTLKHIPGLGPKIDALYERVLGASGSPAALPPMVTALFNPYVSAVFEPRLLPGAKKIKTASGLVHTASELRQALIRERVLSSYAGSSLREHMTRAANGEFAGAAPGTLQHALHLYLQGARRAPLTKGVVEPLRKLSSEWADLADWAEQRQRVALFTDLVVRRGYSFEAAGRVVRDALYDWGGHITIGDVGLLQRLVMFYRFWRHAIGQGVRTLLDPMVRGGEDSAARIARNLSGIGYVRGEIPYKTKMVRDMVNFTEGMRTAQAAQQDADADNDGVVSEAEAKLWEYRKIYPWWLGKNARISGKNAPLSAGESAWYLANFGDSATYETTTYPAFTPLDTTSLLMSAAGALAMSASGKANSEEAVQVASNIAEGFMSEPIGEALQGMTEYFLQDSNKFASKGDKLKKPWERIVFSSAGQTFQYQGDNPDVGATLRAKPFWTRLFRLTPVLGTDIGYWVDPLLMDPVDRRGVIDGASWVIRQWTGLGLSAYHDPAKQLSTAGSFGIPNEVKKQGLEIKRLPADTVDPLGPSPEKLAQPGESGYTP